MAAFESSVNFSETEKNVLRLATAMTRTPANVSDELFAALRRDFSERQMVELTAAIAWENLRARLNRAFGIEAEGFSHGKFCPLPER